MNRFSNTDILAELVKSGEHFANLFKENKAMFIPVPQSGKHSTAEAESFVAQVGDVTMIARYSEITKNWRFRSFIFCA